MSTPQGTGSGLNEALSLARSAVDSRLATLLGEWRTRLPQQSGSEFLDPAATLLTGGKRMRAILAIIGLSLPLEEPQHSEVMTGPVAAHLGAALELYQASALVHDDVIDHAPTRRGHPAAHRHFSLQHAERSWSGDADSYGSSAAILLGDWLLSASSLEMGQACTSFLTAPSPVRALALVEPQYASASAWAARCMFDEMTTEVAFGQFLDVRSEVLHLGGRHGDHHVTGHAMLEAALTVIRHKSARYSVMHPLLLGTVLAGVPMDSPMFAALARFGEEIGIAFQLRDDDLGVLGDPAVTGKPVGGDLREGKRTALLALTWQFTDHSGRELLRRVLGSSQASQEEVEEAAALMESCGARAAHEQLIARHTGNGLTALADALPVLSSRSVADLSQIATLLTRRSS